MKLQFFALLTSLFIATTAFAGKALPEERASEAQILQYITDVQSFRFGSVGAKVITTSSFGEPDEVVYLVLAKMEGFDPETQNSAVYNLDAVVGQDAFLRKVEKKGETLVLTTTNIQGRDLKKIVLKIHDLKASL
jgi:hypothetical protein